MDLHLESIKLNRFRNYDEFSLDSIGPLTIFVGQNAVGKTNVLEALQLCTALSSFRHPTSEQMIKEGSDSARVEVHETDGNRDLTLSMGVEKGQRRYQLNGKSKPIVDLKGLLPAVIFTPDDLALAKSSSGVKRDAIDDLGSQLTKNYYIIKRDYEKVIKYKNRLLKEEAPTEFVKSINDTLITCAAQLAFYRIELFGRIVAALKENYRLISDGEELSVGYYPSWSAREFADIPPRINRDFIKDSLDCALDEDFSEERARKRSIVGPHADKIKIFINGRDVSSYASQGQRRSVVLAWKIAEVAVIRESLRQNPILLLDDVMSELDASRREALLSLVEGDIQTFITTTTLDYFEEGFLNRASIVFLPADRKRIDLKCQSRVNSGRAGL